MKKFFLLLILINIFTININAETYCGNMSISLKYTSLPKYSVKIPKNIDVTNNTTSFNYYVSGDIYADQTLQVLFDNQTALYSLDNSCKVYISQSKAYFNANELGNKYSTYTCLLTHCDLDPGIWTGQLNVVISLAGGQ